jgi:hypothetical protein
LDLTKAKRQTQNKESVDIVIGLHDLVSVKAVQVVVGGIRAIKVAALVA